MVGELRAKTDAPMMECKKALTETNGDLDAAVDWLRKKGIASAAKKADRVAAEGLVAAVTTGTKGLVLEVNCETDFVARNEDFKSFVRDVAMHIAAAAPRFVRAEEVPAELVAKEKEIMTI